jgi:cell filamentation protein
MRWLALSQGDDSSRSYSNGVARGRRRSCVARSLARSRYDVGRRTEAQFEPGSRRTVLKNLLGIRSARSMNVIERRALAMMARSTLQSCEPDRRFTAADMCDLHRQWLSGIYTWAGEYRHVNMSKGGFLFAAAERVPALMSEFEAESLRRNTPCNGFSRWRLSEALAETHAELVLIHPFRDGNGRIARHLANLMARQAGRNALDFTWLSGPGKSAYLAAVQAALDRQYEPMRRIFEAVVSASTSRA